MEEQLISFETAKLAKEKGFDVPQDRVFVNEGTEGILYYRLYLRLGDTILANAPTQFLLQKWLREVHNIHININTNFDKFLFISFKFDILNKFGASELEDNIQNEYSTYEEALEAGLQEALKLI